MFAPTMSMTRGSASPFGVDQMPFAQAEGGAVCGHLVHVGIRPSLAPSKLQKPAGDRVKTDTRAALDLARSLRFDEIVEVTVPSAEQEANVSSVPEAVPASVDGE